MGSRAELEAVDSNGCTPLMMAVTVGDEHVAKILLKARANPKATDEEGQSVVDYANMFEHKDLVKLLSTEASSCDSRVAPEKKAPVAVEEDDDDAEIETFFAEAEVTENNGEAKIEKKKKRRDSKVDAPVDEHNADDAPVEPEKG